MNTKLLILATGLILLASCGKDADYYQPDSEVSKEIAYLSNAEKMLGVKIDPDHDWCSIVSGQVNIKANASVKKVQLLVNVLIDNDDTQPAWVTRNSMEIINQAETNGRTDLTLYYDAPKENLGLYVAFITDDSYYLSKVENGVAIFSEGAKTRGEDSQTLSTGFTLPETEIKIADSERSYASQRWSSWENDGQLYSFDNYVHLKAAAPYTDYTQDFKDFFNIYIPAYLPNGRDYDNSYRVKNTDAYNNSVYVTPKKDEPVILTPMYKCDHPADCGYEVFYSDLYYYYYKPSEVTGDFAKYIKSLPKYKAIPFDKVFGKEEDMEIYKHDSFALLYFATQHGSTGPSVGDVGSFFFPEGYKIGFMIRAKTTKSNGQKQGELYGDGRLNNEINKFGHFKSSGFNVEGKENFPRILWMSYNGKQFMTWESGTDADFNDFFIELQGGTVITEELEPDLKVFTYCFEDTPEGDYDLNDVVIKATRVNETTVEYSLVACGAHDEIKVHGLGISAIEGDEVHKLFGVSDPQTFINTQSINYPNYPTGTMTVSKDFSFLTTDKQPWIEDLTTEEKVQLSKKGQAPHGILIPTDFAYPTEKTRVTKAYDGFGKWAADAEVISTLWYNSPNPGKTIGKPYKK